MSAQRRRELVPIERIVDMLAGRARALAEHIFPGGIRDGHEWRVGSLAGDKGSSLAVHIGPGARAGVWKDFASGEAGDALDLVAEALCHGDKGQAIQWARAWLGLDGGDPGALRETRVAAERRQAADDAEDEDSARKRAAAHRIYLSAEPDLIGTPVERYLSGRGLELRRLDFPCGALRYHPALWDRYTGRHWPAMVAAIVGAGAGASSGKLIAVHRTFLMARPDGSVVKAPIVNPAGKPAAKRVLGPYRGGVISLSKGVLVDPVTGELRKGQRLSQAPAGQWVDETEGIEDGLTVMMAFPERRVLVGVSVTNLAAVRLPGCVVGTRLWAQNDPPGSKAAAAFDKVVQARLQQGLTVRVVRPPAGIKDANDVLNGSRVGEHGDERTAG